MQWGRGCPVRLETEKLELPSARQGSTRERSKMAMQTLAFDFSTIATFPKTKHFQWMGKAFSWNYHRGLPSHLQYFYSSCSTYTYVRGSIGSVSVNCSTAKGGSTSIILESAISLARQSHCSKNEGFGPFEYCTYGEPPT